jgi:hypothetical protein
MRIWCKKRRYKRVGRGKRRLYKRGNKGEE